MIKGIVPPNDSLSIVPTNDIYQSWRSQIRPYRGKRSSFSWGRNDLVVEFTMKQPI